MKFYLSIPLIVPVVIASLFLAFGTGGNPQSSASPLQAEAVPAPAPIQAEPRATPSPASQQTTAIALQAAPAPLMAEATSAPQAPVVAYQAQSFPGFLIFMVAGLIMIVASLLYLSSAIPTHRTARPITAEA